MLEGGGLARAVGTEEPTTRRPDDDVDVVDDCAPAVNLAQAFAAQRQRFGFLRRCVGLARFQTFKLSPFLNAARVAVLKNLSALRAI